MFATHLRGSLVRPTALMVALVLAAGLVLSTHVIVANASSPPGPCLPSENGREVISNGKIWKCVVANGQHQWIQIGIIAITANANGLIVSDEVGYGGSWYGMLRARSSYVGITEEFALANLGGGLWALNSEATNLSVSAEFGYGGGDWGMLRARASNIADYEKYYLYQIGSQYALQSYTQPGTCCYVSTEIGYGGSEYAMLRARASSVGSWELYYFTFYSAFPSGSATASSTPQQAASAPNFKTEPATCHLASGDVKCQKVIAFA